MTGSMSLPRRSRAEIVPGICVSVILFTTPPVLDIFSTLFAILRFAIA